MPISRPAAQGAAATDLTALRQESAPRQQAATAYASTAARVRRPPICAACSRPTTAGAASDAAARLWQARNARARAARRPDLFPALRRRRAAERGGSRAGHHGRPRRTGADAAGPALVNPPLPPAARPISPPRDPPPASGPACSPPERPMIIREFLAWTQNASAGRRAEPPPRWRGHTSTATFPPTRPGKPRPRCCRCWTIRPRGPPGARRDLRGLRADAPAAGGALSCDVPEVARLVLARSPVLTDADLVDAAALATRPPVR